ncbi:MAG: diacylglycerol kinase family protein [Deinococcota bacterium]
MTGKTCHNQPMPAVLVIVNPASSRTDHTTADNLVEIFQAYNYIPEVLIADAEGDVRSWAKHACNEAFKAVAVVGGDGTIMEVVSGLLEADVCLPIFILPAGTGNLLAHALHIPEDPVKALETLVNGDLGTLDVGYIKNKKRYFMVAAGAGLDAETMQDTDTSDKEKLGRRAYVLATLRNLFKLEKHNITLRFEDDKSSPVQVKAHTVMVFNASKVDVGGIRLGPGVTPHNGLLEVAVLRGVSFWNAMVDMWHLLFHQLPKRDAPDRYSTKCIYIDAQPPLLTQADGDVLGYTPLDIELLPDAIEVFVPKDYLSVMQEGKE